MSRTTTSLALRAMLAIAVSIVTLMPAGAAQAATKQGTTSTEMTVPGFDPEVAKANGFEIRTYPDSTQGPVIPGEMNRDTVVGDCGTAYFQFNDLLDSNAMEISWGFDLSVGPAISLGWSYTAVGPSYSRADSGGEPVYFDRSFDGYFTDYVVEEGLYSGFADMWAVLYDGRICSSADPTDEEYVFI
jgi:hypothetical protein